MPRKPVIGITPSPSTIERSHGTFDLYGTANTYTTAIEAAGGVPIVIPPQKGNVNQLVALVDGLLLSGGGDIDPGRYGDTSIHPTTYGIHPGRDELELLLIKESIDRRIPTLCICRGIQVLNVALGGTLYQDVADQYGAKLNHQQQKDGIDRHDPSHAVRAVDDSLLESVYSTSTIQVNSFHHQGIKELGAGLVAVGAAPDGLVEAVTLPEHPWMLGVQWHPEMMYDRHSEHLRPFIALIEAAVVVTAVTA